MSLTLAPLSPKTLHALLVSPFEEGCARINLAFFSKNMHSLNPARFCWQERLVHLAAGALLMLPLINAIIWIAWKTFGNPEILCDPYCLEALPPPPAPTPAPLAPPHYAEQIAPTKSFSYREIQASKEETVRWTVQSNPDGSHFVTGRSAQMLSTSRYDAAGNIQEFHVQGPLALHAYLRGNHIEINGTLSVLTKQLPWIQEYPIALNPLVLTDQGKPLEFYIILTRTQAPWYNPLMPAPPFIAKCSAKKLPRNAAQNFEVVEISYETRWFQRNVKAILHFDLQGILRTMTNEIEGISAELLPNAPLPAEGHP